MNTFLKRAFPVFVRSPITGSAIAAARVRIALGGGAPGMNGELTVIRGNGIVVVVVLLLVVV